MRLEGGGVFLGFLPTWLTIALYVYALVIIVLLIYDNRDPGTTLSWLFVLLLAPVVGLAFYFFFGRNWRATARRYPELKAANSRARTLLEPLYERYSFSVEQVQQRYGACSLAGIAPMIERMCGMRPLPAQTVEIFAEGGPAFDQMIADIETASDFVHLQFFIWEDDALTDRMIDALIAAMHRGAEVRLCYDLVGSITYRKKGLRRLAAAGAAVRAGRVGIGVVNYRDHRKVLVVDGRVGYTGGMNVGQEYIDGGDRFGVWRDSMVRFTGPFVAQLHCVFCVHWRVETGENLLTERYVLDPGLDDPESSVPVQLAYSSFTSEWPAIKLVYEEAIHAACESVWIQSPYFVPDDALHSTIFSASLTGIDLRFMMTGVPDKKLAWQAAHSYFGPVVEGGGRILLYEPGFLHAKSMTIDHKLLALGTFNVDTRSLLLHDEIMAFIYDEELARQHESIFERDEAECLEVHEDYLASLGRWNRFKGSLGRLAAKLL